MKDYCWDLIWRRAVENGKCFRRLCKNDWEEMIEIIWILLCKEIWKYNKINSLSLFVCFYSQSYEALPLSTSSICLSWQGQEMPWWSPLSLMVESVYFWYYSRARRLKSWFFWNLVREFFWSFSWMIIFWKSHQKHRFPCIFEQVANQIPQSCTDIDYQANYFYADDLFDYLPQISIHSLH